MNLALGTHLDPLKLQVLGYPNPKTKLSKKLLKKAIEAEKKRISRESIFVDEILAKRYAMSNLSENPNYHHLSKTTFS